MAKICKDCLNYEAVEYGAGYYDRCNSPQQKTDPVRGTLIVGYCDLNRRYDYLCGPEAKWFRSAKTTEELVLVVTPFKAPPLWAVLWANLRRLIGL